MLYHSIPSPVASQLNDENVSPLSQRDESSDGDSGYGDVSYPPKAISAELTAQADSALDHRLSTTTLPDIMHNSLELNGRTYHRHNAWSEYRYSAVEPSLTLPKNICFRMTRLAVPPCKFRS
jgi:hypothetical protein